MSRSSGNLGRFHELRGISPPCWILAFTVSAVEQVERLRERRLHFHLARAHGLASRAAEGGAGSRSSLPPSAICDGSGTEREAGELVLGLGDGADRVEQVLGLDPPQIGVGEVPLVGRVARRCVRVDALIGPRVADITNKALQVVF